VAIIGRDVLYSSVAAFIAANRALIASASNLVFITGPSRTADIEFTLSRGVHGPKEVHAVILD
jgi:L-lactate dehydrogenase complex protein LldG